MDSRLRDAHIHLAEHGRQLRTPGLEGCEDLGECLARVREVAAQRGPRDWVVLSGAQAEAWPGRRLPEVRELDEAGGGRPVMVSSFELHTLACSSAALAAARIDDETEDPADGTIVRDAGGRPTGILLEGAAQLVRDVIPSRSDSEYAQDVQRGLQDLADLGFVEVHEMKAHPRLVEALARLDETLLERVKVVLYAPPESLDEVLERCHEWKHPAVRFGGMKLFADGTLNARTAYMLTPYEDADPRHPHGRFLIPEPALRAHFQRARERDVGVAVHALGDAAVRKVLDVYESMVPHPERRLPGVSSLERFFLRVEHAQFIDPEDVPRFARLGAIASVQPAHLLADVDTIRRVYPQGLSRCFPFRDLITEAERAGFQPRELVWVGSDTPVVSPDPKDAIQAAVHRRGKKDDEGDGVNPAQALSRGEILSLMRPTRANQR